MLHKAVWPELVEITLEEGESVEDLVRDAARRFRLSGLEEAFWKEVSSRWGEERASAWRALEE